LKKIFLPFASAFLAYQLYAIVAGLWLGEFANMPLGGELLMAFCIALFGTGIFAFIGFAYPTSKLIGSSYYRLKNTERLQLWYRRLGVACFKKLLLLFFWGSRKNRKKYFNGTRTGIENFIYQTHQSEFGHLGALILVFIANVLALLKGQYAISIFLFGINIVGNLYPIILQRHHRIRLGRFIRNLKSQAL